jgi:WD40 repeat protein
MTSRALSIVDEFVRSPETEDRKNAAALAALGGGVFAVKWGLLGGLFGVFICFFLSVFITRGEWDEDSLANLGLTTIGVSLSIASSIAVTQRSCPINLQLNSRVGSLVDALVAMTYFIVVATLITSITVATVLAMGGWKHFPVGVVTRSLGLLIVLCAGVVGAIRGGTIVGYGLFRSRFQNKLAQTVIGVITALLLAAIFFFLIEPGSSAISGEVVGRLSRLLLNLVDPGDDLRLFWLIFIPAVSGVAYTFATIDSESFSTRPIHGRIAKVICYALTLVFSALLIFTLYLGYRESNLVLTGHQGFVSKLVFSPDARFLAVGAGRWRSKLWEISTLKAANISPSELPPQGDMSAAREATVVMPETRSLTLSAIAYSPDGKLLAMGGDNGLVLLWDTKTRWRHTGNEENSLAPAKDLASGSILNGVSALAFSLDGQTLVSGHMNGSIRFWETKTMKEIVGEIQEKPAPTPDSSIRFIVFRPEGRQFLAIDADAVYLWDFEARKFVGKLVSLDEDIRGITVSANGKLVVWVTNSGMIKLLDLDKGNEIATLSADTQAPDYLLALSADGHLLATCGNSDRAIRLWDTMSQRQIAELNHHESYRESMALSPDGKLLAIGSYKVVRLLDVTKWTKP